MKPTLVFVYGTLKTGGSNNGLLRRAESIGEAVTVADTFTMFDGPYPYTIPEGISRIKGEVFEVRDEATLQNLDRLEGVPTHFCRRDVEVTILGREEYTTANAFMYVASPKTAEYLKQGRGRGTVVPNDNNVCEWDHR